MVLSLLGMPILKEASHSICIECSLLGSGFLARNHELNIVDCFHQAQRPGTHGWIEAGCWSKMLTRSSCYAISEGLVNVDSLLCKWRPGYIQS